MFKSTKSWLEVPSNISYVRHSYQEILMLSWHEYFLCLSLLKYRPWRINFFSTLNENINNRTKVHANNTVQKSKISTVAFQIGSFIRKMISLGCLDITLVISHICFSSTAVVRIYDNDDHVWILNQETGHHNQENLEQRYKFVIKLILAIKPSFHN